jgi:hypothetical protein
MNTSRSERFMDLLNRLAAYFYDEGIVMLVQHVDA